MVVPQKSENQVYADIVRSLKQNLRTEIQPPSVAHGGERKVRIRTGCYYKSQFSDDHWRDKYDRHVKQSVGGFYTPAHVPYASIGDVCLDIRDLVLKTVGCDQESEKSKNLDAIADLSEQEKRTDDEGDTAAQKKPHKLDKRACFAFEDQGGLSEIKGKLLQYRSRLSALRAGQSLDECLGKEDIMFMVVEAMREDEKPKISSAILKQWLKKARPSERFDAIPLLGDELIPAFPSEVNKSEHEEEAIDQRDVRERYIRNFTSKLSCLYTLLCSIYHLRTRDLRTKTPLSRDFLKALRTKVQTDQKGRPLRPTRNTTHTHTLSRGAHQRSSTDVTISRMEHESHLSPLMNTRASFVSDSPSSLFRPGITSTGAIESRQSFSRKLRLRDTSDKIETWEDLIEAGEKPPSNPQAPFPGMVRGGAGNEPGARGGITRTSFLQTVKMPYGMRQRRYGILQALGNQAQTSVAYENMPLWHQVASSEKNSKENGNSSAFQKRRAKKSSSKIESSLSDMITEGFANIQAKSAEWVKDELNRINRKERESFIKKFLAFNPCSLFKVDLQRVQQAGRGVSEAYSRQHVKTATWYGELEQEAQEFGVRREIDVVTCLKKLYPFAIDDVTTVPFVQAKLCLVVQSLPAYELCSLTMMDALKFLLKKILNSSSGTFNEWMNHRKLLNVDKPSSS